MLNLSNSCIQLADHGGGWAGNQCSQQFGNEALKERQTPEKLRRHLRGTREVQDFRGSA